MENQFLQEIFLIKSLIALRLKIELNLISTIIINNYIMMIINNFIIKNYAFRI